MRNLRIIGRVGLAGLVGLAAMLAVPARGQYTVPTFQTLSATGTTTSIVCFATSPLQQTRIVGAIATSDLSTANLQIKSGTAVALCNGTHAIGTSVAVAGTNGFAIGDFVVIERANGAITNQQIASLVSTNIVLNQNVFATSAGDQVYKLGAATLLPVGAATVNYQGEALFVGQKGRPVQVLVNGTSACSISSVTAKYE